MPPSPPPPDAAPAAGAEMMTRVPVYYVVADPAEEWLAPIRLQQPLVMWANQLQKGKEVRGRDYGYIPGLRSSSQSDTTWETWFPQSQHTPPLPSVSSRRNRRVRSPFQRCQSCTLNSTSASISCMKLTYERGATQRHIVLVTRGRCQTASFLLCIWLRFCIRGQMLTSDVLCRRNPPGPRQYRILWACAVQVVEQAAAAAALARLPLTVSGAWALREAVRNEKLYCGVRADAAVAIATTAGQSHNQNGGCPSPSPADGRAGGPSLQGSCGSPSAGPSTMFSLPP